MAGRNKHSNKVNAVSALSLLADRFFNFSANSIGPHTASLRSNSASAPKVSRKTYALPPSKMETSPLRNPFIYRATNSVLLADTNMIS